MNKFYYLKDMTQEDLNQLALERNILQQENQKYKEVIDKAIGHIRNNVKDDWIIVETSIVWELENILKEVE